MDDRTAEPKHDWAQMLLIALWLAMVAGVTGYLIS